VSTTPARRFRDLLVRLLDRHAAARTHPRARREAGVAVAEVLRDLPDGAPLVGEERRARVPQLVRPEIADAHPAERQAASSASPCSPPARARGSVYGSARLGQSPYGHNAAKPLEYASM
jgi:hypothetical protein